MIEPQPKGQGKDGSGAEEPRVMAKCRAFGHRGRREPQSRLIETEPEHQLADVRKLGRRKDFKAAGPHEEFKYFGAALSHGATVPTSSNKQLPQNGQTRIGSAAMAAALVEGSDPCPNNARA